ncbi:MAG TPA: alanine racemase [Acidobacteriaceae bacterium]
MGTKVVAENARSWVEIDEKRLAENYAVVREATGEDTDVLAVVKANAYGHGLERCAVALASAGVPWLGVADAAEGARVRRALEVAGVGRDAVEILSMCGVTHNEARGVAELGLTPVVWTMEQVVWLTEAAHASGGKISMRVHVEVDTGMSRQGVRPGAELKELLSAIERAGLALDGVCTHFSSAEVVGSERTQEQKRRFEAAVAQVKEMGFKPRWVHAGSSSSVDVGGNSTWLESMAKSVGARAMVRAGIALYGYSLPAISEGANSTGHKEGAASHIRARLKPVMTWKTHVLDVREVAAGEAIGYNATFTAKSAMRVAVLPVGYADGLRRELSGTNERAGGWVMLRGADGAMRRANIVGRVSMNLATVDVTGIKSVSVGDEVVLLGDGTTADDHARIAGTIAYEILCGARS